LGGVDPDVVVARYGKGDSMRAIADSYGVTRHVIRRILREAGEPIRRTGRPSTPVALNELVALREAGLSWVAVGAQLGISSEAARQRYAEAKSRRVSVQPNRWQLLLLAALEHETTVMVLAAVASELGRDPTPNEAAVARQAARDLARSGEVTISHPLLTWRGRRAHYLVLTRTATTDNLERPELSSA
jgi:hypothetical protein